MREHTKSLNILKILKTKFLHTRHYPKPMRAVLHMSDNCHTLHHSQGLTDMHDDLFEVVDSPVPLAGDTEEGAERGVGQQEVVADGGLAQLQVIHRCHQLRLCCRHAAGDNSDMDGCMCGSRSGQTHKHVINMHFHACAHKLG